MSSSAPATTSLSAIPAQRVRGLPGGRLVDHPADVAGLQSRRGDDEWGDPPLHGRHRGGRGGQGAIEQHPDGGSELDRSARRSRRRDGRKAGRPIHVAFHVLPDGHGGLLPRDYLEQRALQPQGAVCADPRAPDDQREARLPCATRSAPSRTSADTLTCTFTVVNGGTATARNMQVEAPVPTYLPNILQNFDITTVGPKGRSREARRRRWPRATRRSCTPACR